MTLVERFFKNRETPAGLNKRTLVKILEFFVNEMDIPMGYWENDSLDQIVDQYNDTLEEYGPQFTLKVIATTASEIAAQDLRRGLTHKYINYDKPEEEPFVTVEDVYDLSKKFKLGL